MEPNKSLVGKVYCYTWGYSMTLATFLKVIKETAKTVTVVEVGQDRSMSKGPGDEYASALPNNHLVDFDKNEKVYKGLKLENGDIKGSFGKSSGTYHASEWDGKPVSINTWD